MYKLSHEGELKEDFSKDGLIPTHMCYGKFSSRINSLYAVWLARTNQAGVEISWCLLTGRSGLKSDLLSISN